MCASGPADLAGAGEASLHCQRSCRLVGSFAECFEAEEESVPGTEKPKTKGLNMLTVVARKWWVLLLNGLCGILFGLMAMSWPGLTLLALVILFGA